MTNLAFDTHKFVKNLSAAGMKTEQAEVLADTYAELLTDRLATKEDLRALKKELNAKIDFQGEQLNARIDSLEERLDDKIDSLEKRLNSKIEAQGEQLNAKIDAQGEQLNAKIDFQGEQLNGKMDSIEERLNRHIEQAQTRTVVRITGLLGFLMLILEFFA